MEKSTLNKKILNASKWSSLTEIAAKLIVPITNMILARLLSPESFGVVATVNMIISFTDMFTDAGFQKYIVQHEFKDDDDKIKYVNVAFWTNFIVSILIYIFIAIYSEKIAIMLGNPGLGNVIRVACIQLPMTSFSSIQMALYKREFDFKTLFTVRMVSICLPFIITIPLAFLRFKYWALIIGSICGVLSNAIILTIKSKWKPTLFFEFNILKKMLSFSIWSLVESISIWISLWVDTFIIGNFIDSYYLGIYKTSITTVNSIMAIVTASVTPILFSTLSRLQDDDIQFKKVFFRAQKIISLIILPMGIGIYLYSDVITNILLGEQWIDAKNIIGLWGIVNAFKIIFGNNCSELYRAKGKPKLSFMVQCLFILIYVPLCIIAAYKGIDALIITCIVGRLIIIVVHMIVIRNNFNISINKILNNSITSIQCTIVMLLVAVVLREISNAFIWNIISIIICILVYGISLFYFEKQDMKSLFISINDRYKNA